MRCTIYTIFDDALFFFDKPKSSLKLGRSFNATPLSLPNEGKLLLLLSFPVAFSASPASKGIWNWSNPEASYRTCYTSNINMPALFPQCFPISNPYTLQLPHKKNHTTFRFWCRMRKLCNRFWAATKLMKPQRVHGNFSQEICQTSNLSSESDRLKQPCEGTLITDTSQKKKNLLEDSFWGYCRFK